MCGIAGQLKFNGGQCVLQALEGVSKDLKSRGPDGSGLLQLNEVAFCHRRLSIIDLSHKASQPFYIPELDLVTVFNGEIYNYKELKKDLEGLGHKFFSDSDTEVLTRGYSQWGVQVLSRLNGMFAFAIYDRNEQRLFCARDRLGIKPFYYNVDSQSLSFSSSLPSLVKNFKIDQELDHQALYYYMSFHSIVPAPNTIFKNIKKLPPASYMIKEKSGDPKIEQYWQAEYGRNMAFESWTEDDWEKETLKALEASVQRRLVADVPVGVFLSGGTDSSLVTAMMSQHLGDSLQTFSVGFENVGEEEGNEFVYSDMIAKKFNTKHNKLLVKTSELIDQLPNCIAAMSEPMVSHDNIGFYLLSKFAAEKVKVVQSGQGADEVFAGYRWYPPLSEAKNAASAYANVFFDYSHNELSEVINKSFFPPESLSEKFVKSYFDRQPQLSPVDQALRIDTNIMLVDDPVKRVDNMTMAWGLEARVPFLDHELIELAAAMPSQYKLPDGGKYILKKIARRFVPSAVIDRPKGYFPVPELKYIQGPVLTFVKDTLGSQRAKDRGIFKQEYIDKLLSSPKDYLTKLNGSKLWQIALLEIWLQNQGV